jgi:hypothetical protein
MSSPDPVDLIVILVVLLLYSLPFVILAGVIAFRKHKLRASHKARLEELQGERYHAP